MSDFKITATEIFNWLDAQDNSSDKIIQKSAWNKFQSIIGCNSINNCILEENAIKTISLYLKKATDSQLNDLNQLINSEIMTSSEKVSIFESQKQIPETKNFNIDNNFNIFELSDFSIIPDKKTTCNTCNIPEKEKEKEEELLYKNTIEKSVFNDTDAGILYKQIPSLRQKAEHGEKLTSYEQQLLREFDEMITSICKAGEEYGIDPRLISTIIRRECRYNGIYCKNNSSVGHMQLTRIAIRDFVGDDGFNKIKTAKYGNELEDLLKSRGFKTSDDVNKTELAKEIFTYLREHREDADFNIRLGSLLLRYLLNKKNGNVQKAAEAYNGSEHKYSYGSDVAKRYEKIKSQE